MDDINSTLAQIEESLSHLKEMLAQHMSELKQGKTLAEVNHITDIELEGLYQQAYDFFQEGKFQQALPITLQISALKPNEWRYLFIAGMCFQFLGDSEAATSFYGFTLMVNPACTPAAFRLAECLSASGDQENARHTYEAVITMGRDVPEHMKLQDVAQMHLAAMH